MEGLALFMVSLLSIGAIYSILCLALNLEAGVDGLWDLGIVSFFGVGAYTYTLLTAIPAEGHQHYVLGLELPIWIGVFGAGLAGGIVALLIGSPSLRLKQEYFLITTLAFAEVIRQIYANELWLTNGVAGIFGLTPPFREMFDPQMQAVVRLGLIVFALIVAYWVVQSLTVSPFGRGLKALRENEALAKTAGINPFSFHIRAFVACGVMTGVAGSFYVWYNTIIIPGQFVADVTFFVWTAIIIGGIGNNRGALIGGFLFIFLYDALRFIPVPSEYAEVIASVRTGLVGVVLIIVLRLRPNGLFKERPQRLRVRSAD
ncbi:MAG: branched-chain amino acid ABC transporter permease [Rhizobiales bacterium]|nr:branched-chain amino acid ABC transporter permease [Hyphomicrobiales bacterium]